MLVNVLQNMAFADNFNDNRLLQCI